MIRIATSDGRVLERVPDPQLTLAQAIFLAGLWDGVPLCAGLGKCGLCRVRFVQSAPPPRDEELRRLGAEALAQGWRLSCLHPAQACDIELPEPKRSGQARQQSGSAGTAHARDAAALAVDLGTTSIHWTALSGHEAIASGQELNPQMGLGSEVMSRLGFAARPGGADILRGLVLDRLRQLVAAAEHKAKHPCRGCAWRQQRHDLSAARPALEGFHALPTILSIPGATSASLRQTCRPRASRPCSRPSWARTSAPDWPP
jgi:ferredoxin